MATTKKQIVKNALSSVKMQDMGHMMSDSCCFPSKMDKNKKFYPSFYLSGKEADFLKDHNVGEQKKFVILGMLRSKTLRSNAKNGDSADFDVEIQKMGVDDSK
jgi:hypothetical protein